MQRRFFQTYKVRYDECNMFGQLTPAATLRFLQDIAGLDATETRITGGADWVARRTIINFHQPVAPRCRIQIETFPIGFTKVTAQRGYALRILDGQEQSGANRLNGARLGPLTGPELGLPAPAISARTTWVYLGPNGRPARLPTAVYQAWQPEGLQAPLPDEPWPPVPAGRPLFTSRSTVRFSDLDLMSHMNNTAYVDLLDNAAWEALHRHGLEPRTPAPIYPVPHYYDIEYLVAATAGEELAVHSRFEPLEAPPGCYELHQQVYRESTLLVKARSRWGWQTASGQPAEPPQLNLLWQGQATLRAGD